MQQGSERWCRVRARSALPANASQVRSQTVGNSAVRVVHKSARVFQRHCFRYQFECLIEWPNQGVCVGFWVLCFESGQDPFV